MSKLVVCNNYSPIFSGKSAAVFNYPGGLLFMYQSWWYAIIILPSFLGNRLPCLTTQGFYYSCIKVASKNPNRSTGRAKCSKMRTVTCDGKNGARSFHRVHRIPGPRSKGLLSLPHVPPFRRNFSCPSPRPSIFLWRVIFLYI